MSTVISVAIGFCGGFTFGMVLMAAFRRPPPPAPGRHRAAELSFDDLLEGMRWTP